ncbi:MULTISPECIES: hypothetical protein [Vibrio harveyi group]|uniref:hypothetical protein n=1 Tax=Vibrio harveyi group TaxID=717610 RepID=UPI00112157FD|nr:MULTISPECIES: hypothetical protein [Vibrio harveyi group]ELA8362078.1 hypothetical protein [Vibrio alginolyticus]ELA8364563.1 hypothetical protein [Vibrio alginolyticus]KAB5598647.1 hypothetical protein F0578_15265 [Vibrio parahaemolyticus]MCR9515647.1 hypothetical protein [Vibrio alginolyticus]MCR9728606.1 hypothetical protein [Vibrio parahaemolyticus]
MKNLHFLLRYSDKLSGADTIAEHSAVIAANGSVWMGKFGIGMNQNFVKTAKLQLERGESCYLYLMHGSKFTCKASIIDVTAGSTSKTEISSREPYLTPAYYRNKKCSIWFKLTSIEPINEAELKELWLYNNPSCHPSSSGMRGLVYLTHNSQPIDIPKKQQEQERPSIYTEKLFD